jgi:hypothetical protein
MIDDIGSPPSGGGPERISLSSIKTTGLDPTGALGLVTRPKLTIKSRGDGTEPVPTKRG